MRLDATDERRNKKNIDDTKDINRACRAACGQVLAVPAEGAAQHRLVVHHELVLRLVRQVLAQSTRVEVPDLIFRFEQQEEVSNKTIF